MLPPTSRASRCRRSASPESRSGSNRSFPRTDRRARLRLNAWKPVSRGSPMRPGFPCPAIAYAMKLSDIGTTEAESNHGSAGPLFRNTRQEQAARKLAEVAPLLTETLTRHWSTGQGTRVRHILWSLYSCSHLVNLGDACSGLDANLAEAVGVAIRARLIFGPEIEPLLGDILRVSGEIARFDREETATPMGQPVIYPPTPASAETLRQLVAAAERRERLPEIDCCG